MKVRYTFNMQRKFFSWIIDYYHAVRFYRKTFVYRKPPNHYLEQVIDSKYPIILIPGINTKWQFLKMIADELSLLGHPIYIMNKLGYNRMSVAKSTKLLRELIDEENLSNVIVLAHSKGGLIAKEALLQFNTDKRIIKVVAVATPFLGSNITKLVPDKAAKELAPDSDMILDQNKRNEVNHQIISIYGFYDNHVWPTENSHLAGAENLQVAVDGHHKLLWHPDVRRLVIEKIQEISE
jgi:hypothetical protein